MASRREKFIKAAVFAGMKAAFTVGEKVAPQRAARAAQTLWLRVPTPPPFQRRHRGVTPEETFTVQVGDVKLPVHAWGQGPTVLLVHGWSAWWEQYSVWIEPLLDAGFRVLTCDMPSHGDAPAGRFGAKRSAMLEFQETIDAIVGQVGHLRGVVAHSGGALATAMVTVEEPVSDKLVFVAPSTSVHDVITTMGGKLGWGPKTRKLLWDNVETQFGVDLNTYDISPRAAASPHELPPLLIVHDHGDGDAPFDGGKRLSEQWPNARLIETTGLGHHKVLWASTTVTAAVEFLAG